MEDKYVVPVYSEILDESMHRAYVRFIIKYARLYGVDVSMLKPRISNDFLFNKSKQDLALNTFYRLKNKAIGINKNKGYG